MFLILFQEQQNYSTRNISLMLLIVGCCNCVVNYYFSTSITCLWSHQKLQKSKLMIFKIDLRCLLVFSI